MKVRTNIFFFAVNLVAVLSITGNANAQQYKLRQSTSMMGMKSESTIYVKAMRKRTEGGGYMGMANLTTIEQCDLQRTIRINDKKKLYYIAPFSKEAEEIAGEDVKPAAQKAKPVVASSVQPKDKTGGVITMWYNVTDTGERKKMYGFTARHLWTTQKIKPSADACTMKDSMIIKTDGWYIDLPQFNCPVQFVPSNVSRPAGKNQLQCLDRYVSRRSGKGKLGFPLTETKTMIMGNGSGTTSEFETSIETMEFSTAKLDSMLFEIPLGYKQVSSEEELQDKMDVTEMMQQSGSRKKEQSYETTGLSENKQAGMVRIGVYEPKGNEQLEVSALQQHLVNTLSDGNVEAVAIASKEDAKKYHCDLVLTTDFIRVKQGSKVGGLLKAIKNTDPFAVSSYNIEAELTLANLSDGSTRLQQKVNGKYEGKPGGAAKLALDKGCSELLKELN
jgi:hypothetical protein